MGKQVLFNFYDAFDKAFDSWCKNKFEGENVMNNNEFKKNFYDAIEGVAKEHNINPYISKYDFLPNDVKNVIISKNAVIVNLKNGCKGISKCSRNDEFDTYTGFVVAYYKAKNSKSFKLKEVLDSCVRSANEKGYHNAILKNE